MPSVTTKEAFDFESHGRRAADDYRELVPRYERYAGVIRQILLASIPSDWPIHSIEGRGKSVESFERKSRMPDESDRAKPKYSKPLEEITDLSGVRVITFFPKTLDKVNGCIGQEFEVIWKRDIGEDRFAQGRFGYRSIHYLVKLKQARSDLPEYKDCRDLVAEIQVRTILQHAWAEMEHDIEYKSVEQIPTSIQRRFVALAGMLEIADREFQTIQDEDSNLRSAVRASLQDDLTKTTLIELESPRRQGETAKDEAEEGPREVAQALKSLTGWNPTRARALVATGEYADAISLYSRMIQAQPNLHTLYVGRAKAKFLAGDRTGALVDIEQAATNLPNDPSIPVLRRQMEEGVVTSPSALNEAWQLSASGNGMLATGHGEDAFKLYSKAQEIGFHFAFSNFNKAMACALIKDTDGASYFLEQLTLLNGTPMQINILGLRAIIAAIAKSSAAAALRQLADRRSEVAQFDFQQSPLRHLEAGLKLRDTKIPEQVVKVFKVLKEGTLSTDQ